ncbi:MAG: aspartyl/asparaginyl beta-hydroxylase domain-containing protein [Sphingomonas sp.]|nr:aspartyl/asparaginyl beta-hydroxylase domain-containing protein [Sphingomonas sp.]
MPLDPHQEQALLQQGVAALQQGRAAEARARLEQLTGAGSANPIAWLLLAIACRASQELAAEEAAVDRLLQLDGRSLRGLIMKADCRAAAGDQGAARQFYRTAIGIAEATSVPPDAVPEVEHARKALAALDEAFHEKRTRLMTNRGFPPENWSPRFRHALELAAGKRRQYYQRPTIFTYPELPQVQYYDPADFDWSAKIEAQTATVRAELVELLKQGTDNFRPYIQAGEGDVRLDANKALVENRDWSALFLCENGKPDEALIERCPATWAAVNQAPLASIPGWGPTVMFSLLKAGARIEPHTGMFNTRLVCHLPLIVPPKCIFRVGNEVREWREGKLFIFDDTIEHEAWNDSDQDRVVLIFDIWRPELSEQEKAELTALLMSG